MKMSEVSNILLFFYIFYLSFCSKTDKKEVVIIIITINDTEYFTQSVSDRHATSMSWIMNAMLLYIIIHYIMS